MKALCWHGTTDVRIDTVPDPQIQDPGDIIIRVTATGICGSDLHLFNGFVPTMKSGDVLGHEPMGQVVEVGRDVRTVSVGDRVVIPFTISCGACFFCQRQLYSLCERSNPNAEMARAQMGHSPAALFGYSHLLGGIPGGQAEYLRVPYADVGALKIESDLPDEAVLFLSDIFPTGYMAAENCGIEPGDVVAVWGCGPVGQFAIQSAWMLGAGRVIGIDHVQERLDLAARASRAEVIHFDREDVYARLMDVTSGRGPDRCIDAVGCEAHTSSLVNTAVDRTRETLRMPSDRPYVLREAVHCCRSGGTLSIPGAYIGSAVPVPMGALMNKALTVRTGQTHMQRYMKPLLERIERHELDPAFVVTHRVSLDEAPAAYKLFNDRKEGCIKVVIKP